ncbi:MAG: hypothetical protein ABI325_03155 [Ginsengibacter sp.]
MPSQQLSFWDNEALETGYRLLADLKMGDAERQFKKALEAGIGETDSVKKLLEACEYWQIRLKYSPENNDANSSSEQIDSLLTAFVHYPFSRQMNAFKKALLSRIVSLLYAEEAMDLKNMETAFDLLLAMDDFQNAEKLVSQSISQHPGKLLLLYLLAQVQWISGNRSEANNNYAALLLYHPDRIEFYRIENEKLQELIQTYGAAMTPAYGWLHNVLPLVSLPEEIEIQNDEHCNALECYRLLLGSNKALLNNERNLSAQYRRELKTLAPDLFGEYFKWLQKQG